ncbi:MAG: ABC transporter permease [Saprospiraceae bacterium]|nr:ABC transporter permease [Saprospiraceae bacterium]
MSASEFIASRSFYSFKKSFTRRILYLSVLATSLSLAVILIAQSIFNGFQKEIALKVFGFWGHIHITDLQSSQRLDPIPMQLDDSIVARMYAVRNSITGKPLVDHVQSFIVLPGILTASGQSEGIFFKGVGGDFRWEFFSDFLVSGRVLQPDNSSGPRELLVSEETARRLQLKPGDAVVLNFVVRGELLKRRLLVAGIYNTGLAEYDRKFALTDIRLIQNLLKLDSTEVTGIEVFCKDVLEAETANRYLYDEVLPENWYSETIREKFPNIFEWLSLQTVNKVFLLSLILAVCIINMATTLMILILERTHMIGVLIVLGMPFHAQRKIFLWYAARILGWSLALGNGIALPLLYLQHRMHAIKLSEADYYLDHAPVDLSLGPVVLINTLFFTVVLLSLIMPSWLVSSIKPVNALKFR